MFKTSYGEKKNRVFLQYEGDIDAKQAEELYLKFQTLIPKCPRGFKLLVDLSTVGNVGKGVLPFIKKIMDLSNRQGVSEVIRIIPNPEKDIGLNILSVFHYSKEVKIRTFQSLDQVP